MGVKCLLPAAVFLISTSIGAFADNAASGVPAEVSQLINDTVTLVLDEVSTSGAKHTVVYISGIELNGSVPPLGRLFAMTTAIRLLEQNPAELVVRSSRSVSALLEEDVSGSQPVSGSEAVDTPPTDGRTTSAASSALSLPDYVVYGEAFHDGQALQVAVHVIRTADEVVVGGLERTVPLSGAVVALLGSPVSTDSVDADPYEPDADDEPVKMVAGDRVGGRAISPAGDDDWFLFLIDGLDQNSLLTVGTEGETDTYLEAFGPDENLGLIAENDDAHDDNAEISFVVHNGDTILVRVTGYDESETGAYSLYSSIEPFPGDPLEPNDTIDNAVTLQVDARPLSSMLVPGSDVDWFVVTVDDPPPPDTVLSVATTGDLDTYLELYDTSGSLVLSNDDGGESDNGRLDLYIDRRARYFVNVSHYDGSQQGNYQISARLLSAVPDQFEPDDSRAGARKMAVDGVEQRRNFTPADDQDWALFSLSEAQTVNAYTTGDIDTYLRIYDNLGNLVAEDDDGGSDYNASIEKLLQKGDYYIQVEQVEGDSVFGAEYSLYLSAGAQRHDSR